MEANKAGITLMDHDFPEQPQNSLKIIVSINTVLKYESLRSDGTKNCLAWFGSPGKTFPTVSISAQSWPRTQLWRLCV
jgi:hypothetical protein